MRDRFPALRQPAYRLFVGGQFVSLIGSLMQHAALGWLVLALSDSPLQVGLVQALGTLPILLFGLLGGVLADRWPRQRTLVACQALFMLQATGLTVLTATGRVTVPWIAAIIAAAGLVSALEIPVRQAFVYDVVGGEGVTSAVALNATAFNLARVLGPALGGVLVAAVGFPWCFGLNAVSFLAVLASLLLIRLPHPERRDGDRPLLRSLREGARWLRRAPQPRAIVLLSAALTVFGFQFMSQLPVFARDVLHQRAEGYGVLVAAVGLGAAAGALLVAGRRELAAGSRGVALSGAAFGVALALAGWAPTYGAALAAMTAVGALMATNGISANSSLQRLVPGVLRGRVIGFYAFGVMGFAPLGALFFGWTAEHLGGRWALTIGGAVCAVCGGLVAAEREPEAAAPAVA